MKKQVKITTFARILEIIYPCYCQSCGKRGEAFCECCFNYNSRKNPCFCSTEVEGFERIFVCGLREGIIKEMIAEYKFYSRRYLAEVFAKMICECLERFDSESHFLIVPLPTIRKHIRERGFDHILEICKIVDEMRSEEIIQLLERRNNTVQVGKNSEERMKQAEEAYVITKQKIEVSMDAKILLVDDVWTTGASMKAARKVLSDYGFKNIYGIVIAKNDSYDFS